MVYALTPQNNASLSSIYTICRNYLDSVVSSPFIWNTVQLWQSTTISDDLEKLDTFHGFHFNVSLCFKCVLKQNSSKWCYIIKASIFLKQNHWSQNFTNSRKFFFLFFGMQIKLSLTLVLYKNERVHSGSSLSGRITVHNLMHSLLFFNLIHCFACH